LPRAQISQAGPANSKVSTAVGGLVEKILLQNTRFPARFSRATGKTETTCQVCALAILAPLVAEEEIKRQKIIA
jgi:hypothetical protein